MGLMFHFVKLLFPEDCLPTQSSLVWLLSASSSWVSLSPRVRHMAVFLLVALGVPFLNKSQQKQERVGKENGVFLLSGLFASLPRSQSEPEAPWQHPVDAAAPAGLQSSLSSRSGVSRVSACFSAISNPTGFCILKNGPSDFQVFCLG